MSKSKKVLSVVLAASMFFGGLPIIGALPQVSAATETPAAAKFIVSVVRSYNTVYLNYSSTSGRESYTLTQDGEVIYEGKETIRQISGLKPNTTYVFGITNHLNGQSSPETTVTLKTPERTLPGIKDIDLEFMPNGGVHISWKKQNSAVYDYRVSKYATAYVGSSPGQKTRIESNQYFDNTPAPGSSYTFAVEGLDSSGNVLESEWLYGTAPDRVDYSTTKYKLGNKLVDPSTTFVRVNNNIWKLIDDNTLFTIDMAKKPDNNYIWSTWYDDYSFNQAKIPYPKSGMADMVLNWIGNLTDIESDALVESAFSVNDLSKSDSVSGYVPPIAVSSLYEYHKYEAIHGALSSTTLLFVRDQFSKTRATTLERYSNARDVKEVYGNSNEKRNGGVHLVMKIAEGTTFAGTGTQANPFRITGVIETPVKISAPTNLKASTSQNTISVSWDAVKDAQDYTMKIDGVIVYKGTATNFDFTDAQPNKSYNIEVFGNKNGEIPGESTSTTIMTKAILSAPVNLRTNLINKDTLVTSWNTVSGAEKYTVLLNGKVAYSGDETTKIFYDLVPNTTYVVEVYASNSGIDGNRSSQIIKTPDSIPTNPTNFKIVANETSITVSWDEVVGATSYRVKIDDKVVYNGSELTYTGTGLVPERNYKVSLQAINTSGESGEQIQTIKTESTNNLPLSKPDKPLVRSTEEGNVQLIITPTSDAVLYKILRNGVEIGSTAGTLYTDKTAANGETYLYTIKSFDGVRVSEPSDFAMVNVTEKNQVPVTLDMPSNFTVNPKENTAYLSWSMVPGAKEYRLKRGDMAIYMGPLTTFLDKELSEGTSYRYSVEAIKDTLVSEAAVVDTITLVRQLPYPSNLRISELLYNKVYIEWDAVDGADEYEITRDGMTIGVPMGTFWIDDLEEDMSGSTLTYRVAAVKNGVNGKVTMKVVTIPTKPVQGEAPSGELVLKVNRVYHDRVGLSWNTVTGATYYDVYQDETNKVWTGTLNTITDRNLGAEESHTYKVVAGNADGELASNLVSVTTPAAPQNIFITPSKPIEGTITFDFKVIDGAVTYVERNPQTTYTPVGDGTYHKTYYNAATGESRDEGIVTPVDGKLNFSESGVDPSKDYHYDIVAVMKKADGTEEVVAKEEVSVNTPADGSGATIPGTGIDPDHGGTTPTEPGTGGGNTPTPDPGTGTGGTPSPSNPSTPGNGSSPTNPSTGVSNPGSGSNSGSSGTGSKGTVTVPGTVGNSAGKGETNEDTPSISETAYSDIEGSFAKEAILSLTDKGIIKGYSNGTYGGKKKVTRAEFAIFLNRALGYVSDSPFEGSFKDLDGEAWYAPELNSALVHGITKGFNDGKYRPNAFIPREQAAIMLANVLLKKGLSVSTTVIPYADQENIVNWARESVNLVTQESVMSGYPGHKFLPKREMTREEAAQLIFNLIKS